MTDVAAMPIDMVNTPRKSSPEPVDQFPVMSLEDIAGDNIEFR